MVRIPDNREAESRKSPEYQGKTAQKLAQDGLGVGIQNAIERLEVLYEGKAELKIGRDRPNGTRVELILERKEKGDA